MIDLNILKSEQAPEKETKLHQKYIKDSEVLIEEAFNEIKEYQTGKKRPVVFSKEFLNTNLLGGLFPGNIITIAGISGGGKSYLLQSMERDIFDRELNPRCDNYILLRNNYEMSVRQLLLREIKSFTKKPIAEILREEFIEEEMDTVDGVINKESNPNIKYFENAQDPETWFSVMCSFCESHKDKEMIIITLDHVALVKDGKTGKKSGIDNTLEYANQLRHIYKNVSFIILSQLNRNIEDRTENPKTAPPKRSDLYASDTLYHISDAVIVVHQPSKLGIEEYMAVGRDQYVMYNQFKKAPDKKTSTFVTRGLIFYHWIKLREMEDGSLQQVYIEQINKKNKPTPPPERSYVEPNPALFTDEGDELYS